MALHELATNAAMHGSLSESSGRVGVSWALTHTEQGLTLILDWKEIGTPKTKRESKPGFGTRLIDMVIERQLNGRVHQSFAPEGLQTRLAGGTFGRIALVN
jgi:two-component sensor histidine kinase